MIDLKMSSHGSVLVVDDNTEALATFTQLLQALGVKDICQAASAEWALELLERRQFTMILCDYRIEGMDGLEFLARLRARGDDTPVIMLSGAPDKAGVVRAANYQRVDFFSKPFRILELASAMNRFSEAA